VADLVSATGMVRTNLEKLLHFMVKDGEAVRVKRGSMTTSLAWFSIFASITHLKPHGCASAALPPMTTTTLAFLISCHVLVIAPRPNVGARLATVGPCQTRA